jgi:hypothetical protein
MSNLVNRARSRKFPVQDQLVDFPPYLTAKLGNVDSRNLTCAVVLATLDRWNIEHTDGVAYIRRSEVRNLRRAWFGSKGTRVRPAGKGTMRFELFDGFLRMDFDAPRTWEEAGGLPEPGYVRLTVRGIGQ